MLQTRFNVDDAERAHAGWGANCGPGALAAIMGMTLDEIRPYMAAAGFEDKHYTSPSMMNTALRTVGRPWRKIGAAWPEYGLVRIQWEGRWTEPGVPLVARYRHTHWIGAQKGHTSVGVFDINCINNGSGWVSLADWSAHVVPWLTSEMRGANGKWSITHAIEIDNEAA